MSWVLKLGLGLAFNWNPKLTNTSNNIKIQIPTLQITCKAMDLDNNLKFLKYKM
jgi:hypothetical protein